MIVIRRLQPGDSFHDLIELSRSFFAEYEAHHPEFFKIEGLRDDDIITATANRAALELYARQGMVPLCTTLVGSTGDRPSVP